jgi:hypothetical protein
MSNWQQEEEHTFYLVKIVKKIRDYNPTITSEFVDTKRSKQPQSAVFQLKQQLGGFYLSLPFHQLLLSYPSK